MRIHALASVSSVAILFATGAFAQSATAPSAGAQAQSGASSDAASPQRSPQTLPSSSSAPAAALSEIVVTAQQRGENLQKAAVAVDVVKGSDLVASGVTNIDALTKLVPALSVEGTSQGSLIFIRGVGNFTLQAQSDPASAFNVDGVYLGRPISNAGTFYDLQRIEVLKGPQGTLYGRNATAGAINVLPVQPILGKFSGYETTSYGNYNAVVTEGALNIPFGNDVALRVSGSYDRHDGYLNDGTSNENSGGARVQLKARLTPDLSVRFSFDYAHQGGAGEGSTYLSSYALNPATNQYVFTPTNLNASEGIFSPASQAFKESLIAGTAARKFGPLVNYPFEDNAVYDGHTQVDWNTSLGTFTVLPAYVRTDKNNLATGAITGGDQLTADQYSIEARLVSNPGKVIDYNLGVYYFNEHVKDVMAANVSSISQFTTLHASTSSPAGYGRLTWHVTDRLRLTGGLRYTADSKSFSDAATTLALACLVPLAAGGCPTAPLLPFTNTLAQQPYVPAASGGRVAVTPTALVARVDSTAASTLSEDKLTYRGAVEFDVAPRSLAYASVETGYRSGGFNTAVGFSTYAPETITAYTLGLKNRFFDNRAQLNVELFDWEYRDQQLSVLGVDATGRSTIITRNIGQSTIRGVELEGQVLLTPQTILSADVQYLDATYNSFVYKPLISSGYPVTGCAVSKDATTATLYDVNCSGKPAFNSPTWTVNAGIQHTIPVSDFDIVLSANTQFKSGRYVAADYIADEYVGDTTQTDAQISLSRRGGPWAVAAYVHNLENDRILFYATTAVGANFVGGEFTPPRTYGVRVSAKF